MPWIFDYHYSCIHPTQGWIRIVEWTKEERCRLQEKLKVINSTFEQNLSRAETTNQPTQLIFGQTAVQDKKAILLNDPYVVIISVMGTPKCWKKAMWLIFVTIYFIIADLVKTWHWKLFNRSNFVQFYKFSNKIILPLLLYAEEFQLFQRKMVSHLDLVASTAEVVRKVLDVCFWEL